MSATIPPYSGGVGQPLIAPAPSTVTDHPAARHGSRTYARVGRLEFVKRWSPAFVPPVVGALLLLLAVFFAAQGSIAGAPSVSPATLIGLLAIYLALGVVWGFALYLATETLRWLLVVLGGIASYLIVTASVYWGSIGGVILVVLIALLAAWYGRRRTHEVPVGSASVTTLAGAHLRTLRPGLHILAPGERVHTTIAMPDRTIVCGPVEIHLPGVEDQAMVARAAAVIGFRTTPAIAHRIVFAPTDWARELDAAAAAALQQSLDEWARLPQSDDDESPAGQLAAIYKRDLTEHTRGLGLRNITIHIQEVELNSEDDPYLLDAQRRATNMWNASNPPIFSSPGAITAPLPAPADTASSPSMRAVSSNNSVTPPPLPDALDPEVLTRAYQAVADRRITDPATIRAIAEAFAAVARDPVRASEVQFDAASAARILLSHAAKLERLSNR